MLANCLKKDDGIIIVCNSDYLDLPHPLHTSQSNFPNMGMTFLPEGRTYIAFLFIGSDFISRYNFNNFRPLFTESTTRHLCFNIAVKGQIIEESLKKETFS